MIKKPESEKLIEDKLAKGVKALGGWSLKLLPTFVTGLPDRLVLLRGRAYFAELKTAGKRARPDQLVVHRKLEKLGFKVSVIDSTDGVNHFLNEINDN